MRLKWKRQNRKAVTWILAAALCFTAVFSSTNQRVVDAVERVAGESSVMLRNPVIDAEKGKVVWDCVYFGNYWQSEYVTSEENRPEQGEDDVVHTDTDGTKYLVREDGKCYKYEPIKWRVLWVNEEGEDAFLMADKNLDAQSYHTVYSDTVTWEDANIRTWLNEDFMNTAFMNEEKEGILPTEIANKKGPEYVMEEGEEEEAATTDSIYLLSREEITSRAYGFVDHTDETETRQVENTDFARAGGTAKAEAEDVSANYWLRTMGAKGHVSHVDSLDGGIPTENLYALLAGVNDTSRIRPVLHLDLTKTELWSYAGKVKQDGTETVPDASSSPAAPTQEPEIVPGVTMAPEQLYPQNPLVNETDVTKNTWDCIYFGQYYNADITPVGLTEAWEHDSVVEDEENKLFYLVRHEQGYFQYQPIKWRVLSVNEDGSDAFLMADQVIDVAPYYQDGGMEITWEKSDIRKWLNGQFMETAFTADEQAVIKMTEVTTADNQWSQEPGGNDTEDQIYLPSIEEMLNVDYGFSSDVAEGNTRKITVTDYAERGGTPYKPNDGFLSYWLRSPGAAEGCPAQVGHWGEGEILTESSVMLEKATAYLGVRPVLHVDLSDTSLWTYAGQVTSKGVVVPDAKEPTSPPDATVSPSLQPTKTPDTMMQPTAQTEKPQQTVAPKTKKPGKPIIKRLKNKKAKKVTVTLSKKISGASGYQVAYATKSSMKGQKKKNFKGVSVTVKGLKQGKAYYFRVRAYIKQNGKMVYGSWGKKKSIKIKI